MHEEAGCQRGERTGNRRLGEGSEGIHSTLAKHSSPPADALISLAVSRRTDQRIVHDPTKARDAVPVQPLSDTIFVVMLNALLRAQALHPPVRQQFRLLPFEASTGLSGGIAMRRLIPSLFIVLSFFPGLAHGVLVNVTLPAGLPPIAPMGDRGPLPIGETTQEIFFSASPDPDTDEFFVGGKVVAENKGGKVFTLSLTDFVFSHDQVGVLSVTVEMVQDYKMIEAVMLDGGSASHMFDGEATFVCCAVLQSSKVTMNSEHEGFGLDEISNFQTAIRPFPDLRRTAAGPTGRDDFIPIDPYTIISKVEVELDGSNVATSRTGPAEIQLIRLDLPSSADNVGVVRTIPVPATHLLLGLGLAATACTRRRRGC